MKKALTIALILVAVSGVFWVAQGWTLKRPDEKIAKFNALRTIQRSWYQ